MGNGSVGAKWDAQFRFDTHQALKDRVEAVFARQICSNNDGMNALLTTFVELEDLAPLLLRQVRGDNRRDLARAILRRMARGK
jgi:hypothetical protein